MNFFDVPDLAADFDFSSLSQSGEPQDGARAFRRGRPLWLAPGHLDFNPRVGCPVVRVVLVRPEDDTVTAIQQVALDLSLGGRCPPGDVGE